MRTPEVELLWWEGCPSTERALGDLRDALVRVGVGHVEVHMREVRSEADAQREGFVGSPTIRIDGVDPVAVEVDEPTGLSCRIYRRRDGSIRPTPDPQDLTDALERATAARV